MYWLIIAKYFFLVKRGTRGTCDIRFAQKIEYAIVYDIVLDRACCGLSPEGSVKSLSKTDIVYNTLRQRIAAGDYSPGFRLVIDALSRDLGVSPIPVREALRRLQAEGMVRHRPNIGAEVTGIDDGEYAEIVTVLARLEAWVTSSASPLIGPADLADLSAIAHEMSQVLDQSQLGRYAELDRIFHARIRQYCPNRFLATMADRTWNRLDQVRRNIFVLVPDRARESLQDHYQIIQSLREKAPQGVLEALMENHQLKSRDAYLAYKASGQGTWFG